MEKFKAMLRYRSMSQVWSVSERKLHNCKPPELMAWNRNKRETPEYSKVTPTLKEQNTSKQNNSQNKQRTKWRKVPVTESKMQTFQGSWQEESYCYTKKQCRGTEQTCERRCGKTNSEHHPNTSHAHWSLRLSASSCGDCFISAEKG